MSTSGRCWPALCGLSTGMCSCRTLRPALASCPALPPVLGLSAVPVSLKRVQRALLPPAPVPWPGDGVTPEAWGWGDPEAPCLGTGACMGRLRRVRGWWRQRAVSPPSHLSAGCSSPGPIAFSPLPGGCRGNAPHTIWGCSTLHWEPRGYREAGNRKHYPERGHPGGPQDCCPHPPRPGRAGGRRGRAPDGRPGGPLC